MFVASPTNTRYGYVDVDLILSIAFRELFTLRSKNIDKLRGISYSDCESIQSQLIKSFALHCFILHVQRGPKTLCSRWQNFWDVGDSSSILIMCRFNMDVRQFFFVWQL